MNFDNQGTVDGVERRVYYHPENDIIIFGDNACMSTMVFFLDGTETLTFPVSLS